MWHLACNVKYYVVLINSSLLTNNFTPLFYNNNLLQRYRNIWPWYWIHKRVWVYLISFPFWCEDILGENKHNNYTLFKLTTSVIFSSIYNMYLWKNSETLCLFNKCIYVFLTIITIYTTYLWKPSKTPCFVNSCIYVFLTIITFILRTCENLPKLCV